MEAPTPIPFHNYHLNKKLSGGTTQRTVNCFVSLKKKTSNKHIFRVTSKIWLGKQTSKRFDPKNYNEPKTHIVCQKLPK